MNLIFLVLVSFDCHICISTDHIFSISDGDAVTVVIIVIRNILFLPKRRKERTRNVKMKRRSVTPAPLLNGKMKTIKQ